MLLLLITFGFAGISQAQAKKNVLHAVEEVAKRLGNTRSVCRASYVHPAVIDAFMEGWLGDPPSPRPARPPRGLDALEVATLRVLQAAARK